MKYIDIDLTGVPLKTTLRPVNTRDMIKGIRSFLDLCGSPVCMGDHVFTLDGECTRAFVIEADGSLSQVAPGNAFRMLSEEDQQVLMLRAERADRGE